MLARLNGPIVLRLRRPLAGLGRLLRLGRLLLARRHHLFLLQVAARRRRRLLDMAGLLLGLVELTGLRLWLLLLLLGWLLLLLLLLLLGRGLGVVEVVLLVVLLGRRRRRLLRVVQKGCVRKWLLLLHLARVGQLRAPHLHLHLHLHQVLVGRDHAPLVVRRLVVVVVLVR